MEPTVEGGARLTGGHCGTRDSDRILILTNKHDKSYSSIFTTKTLHHSTVSLSRHWLIIMNDNLWRHVLVIQSQRGLITATIATRRESRHKHNEKYLFLTEFQLPPRPGRSSLKIWVITSLKYKWSLDESYFCFGFQLQLLSNGWMLNILPDHSVWVHDKHDEVKMMWNYLNIGLWLVVLDLPTHNLDPRVSQTMF